MCVCVILLGRASTATQREERSPTPEIARGDPEGLTVVPPSRASPTPPLSHEEGKAGGAKGLTCTSTFTYISGCESTVRPEPNSTWEVVSAMLQPHRALRPRGRAAQRDGGGEQRKKERPCHHHVTCGGGQKNKKGSCRRFFFVPSFLQFRSKEFRVPPPTEQVRPEEEEEEPPPIKSDLPI